jgi:hypothetical protein
MTAHAAIAAVPKTVPPSQASQTLLQALLVSRIAYIIGDLEDPEAFDPRGEDGTPVTLVLGYRGQWFWFNEASTAGHDGTTVIVTSATGGRYLVNDVNLLITSVISMTVTDPPDPDDVDEELRPNDGDAYLVPAASSGDWATWTGSIAVWIAARVEWFRITPKAGWFVSVPGATRDVVYRYDSVQADWITGDGGTPGANTVPLSALIGFGLGPVKVQNQTTYAPPGSRKTGATPTMPLGGTASNINDNDDATSAVTSALGDLSAAAFADRIVAQLALAAPTDLISIEARGVLGSAVSSSNAMGLWYKSAGVWSQAGSGFTLSATAQNIQRNGSFAAVTDIALVTEGKNWSTATNTLIGLNAYDATVTGAVGDAYVIASPAIGIFAGHELKVAVCEVANSYTICDPQNMDRVADVALGIDIKWNGTAWVSAAGAIIDRARTPLTESGSTTSDTLSTAEYLYSTGTEPTTLQKRFTDDVGLTFSAKAADNPLIFKYVADIVVTCTTAGGGGKSADLCVCLFRGVESNSLVHCRLPGVSAEELAAAAGSFSLHVEVELEIDAINATPNTYKIAITHGYVGDGVTAFVTELTRRRLSVKEVG